MSHVTWLKTSLQLCNANLTHWPHTSVILLFAANFVTVIGVIPAAWQAVCLYKRYFNQQNLSICIIYWKYSVLFLKVPYSVLHYSLSEFDGHLDRLSASLPRSSSPNSSLYTPKLILQVPNIIWLSVLSPGSRTTLGRPSGPDLVRLGIVPMGILILVFICYQ